MNTKLLAFCLGDGCVSKRYMLSIRHCKEQEEFIKWKREEILKIFPCSDLSEGFSGPYPYIQFCTRPTLTNREPFVEIRNKLYPNGVKFFSKEIVNAMDLYCFAVLYMDDGSLTAKKRNGKIHAYDLNIAVYGEKEECENLINKLSEYGLKFTLKFNKNKYSIRCGTKNARKFLELIGPFCPKFECFKNSKFKLIETDTKAVYDYFHN